MTAIDSAHPAAPPFGACAPQRTAKDVARFGI